MVKSQPLIPQRANLASECARVLELRLLAGEWMDVLPGERKLADAMQVGRDTLRLALSLLESRGVLEPASPGMRRRIAGNALMRRQQTVKPRSVGLLVHDTIELLPQPMLFEIDEIRRALAGKDIELKVYAPTWYGSPKPGKAMDRFLAEEACNVWLMFRSSAQVQRAMMERSVPCLLRGYPHEGIDLPHLDVDWESTARHAATHLWRLGHRRVAVLLSADSMRGVLAAAHGVMTTNAEGFQPVTLTEHGTAAGMSQVVGKILRGPSPPTAFICTRSRQAATLLTLCGSWGIRVPDKLSIISLSSEPFLDYLVPRLTCYRTDPVAVARQVTRKLERLLSGPSVFSRQPWILPDFDPGESTTKCAKP